MGQFNHTDTSGSQIEVSVSNLGAVVWVRDEKGHLSCVILRAEVLAELKRFLVEDTKCLRDHVDEP